MLQPSLLRRLSVAFLFGLLFWLAGGHLYHPIITSVSGWIIRSLERPGTTRLIWDEGKVVVDRDDFPKSSPRPGVDIRGVTFNIILLMTLFAIPPKPLTDRNVVCFFEAAVVLIPIHIFAVIAEVESIYALQLGPWSAVHYGVLSRNFWATAVHFYKFVGVHAVSVVLWLAFSPSQTPAASRTAIPARQKRK